MAGCNCGNKAKSTPTAYIVKKPDGTSSSYRTEVEAAAAAKRTPGATYRPA